MTVDGRKPTFANDRNRPKTAIQVRRRERPLSDRKTVVRLPRSVRQLIAKTDHSSNPHLKPRASFDVDQCSWNSFVQSTPFSSQFGSEEESSIMDIFAVQSPLQP